MSCVYKQLISLLISVLTVLTTYLATELDLEKSIPSPIPEIQASPTSATVLRIVDGDTVELSTGEIVRYIGMDTPENTGQKECLGLEAAQRNSELVLNKQVKLLKDKSETDRYGRLLRYVYVDEVLVNEVLVIEGFALARAYPPDTSKQLQLETAELEAQRAEIGLWGDTCEVIELPL